ncbi:MAG TPA: hypothetical protein VLZ83_11730 [Edaphocola sp.]|nr:hypothetical protein [Edaphocola sp.]
MKTNSQKGDYKLVENFFPEENRGFLPVNLYLLRDKINIGIHFDSRFYVESKVHRNSKRYGASFYKIISNFF